MLRRIRFFVIMIVLLGLSLFTVTQLFSESETVLGKVGNQVITQNDLDEFMKKFAQFKGGSPFSLDEKKMYLDNLIKGFLINMESEKEKLDQKPEVKTKLKLHRMDVLNQEYINTNVKHKITVTEKDVEKIMKDNPNLIPKESLTLKEILVKTEAEANTISNKLKESKNLFEDFSVIAGEKSIAPSKIHGGQKRPVSRGQLPKPLEEVAFKMKQGELSKPIKTEEGYYLLYLSERVERSPAEMKRLEEAIKGRMMQLEINKRTQELMEKKAEELKKSAQIEVYYDRIKKE